MYEGLLQNIFSIARELSSVYSKTPPLEDDASPSIAIPSSDHLEVVIDGFTSGTGSVTLDGTDPIDAVIAETITFPGNGQKISNLEFKTVTRVRTAGLTNEATTGTLTIKTATGSGLDQPIWDVKKSIVGRIVRPRTREAFTLLGERANKSGGVFTKPGVDVQVGDRISLGPEQWEVDEIHRRFNRIGEVHHWQVTITELESPAN